MHAADMLLHDGCYMMDWTRENQALINFGLLIGALVYTMITGFILRVSARQIRTMVQLAPDA